MKKILIVFLTIFFVGNTKATNEDMDWEKYKEISLSFGKSFFPKTEGRMKFLKYRCLFRNLLCPIWTIHPTPYKEYVFGATCGIISWDEELSAKFKNFKIGFFSYIWDLVNPFYNIFFFKDWKNGYTIVCFFVPYVYMLNFKYKFLEISCLDLLQIGVGSFNLFKTFRKKTAEEAEKIKNKVLISNNEGLEKIASKEIEFDKKLWYFTLLDGFLFSVRISVDCRYFTEKNDEEELAANEDDNI